MALETLLGFRNMDSTENINARLQGLVPKGIVKGGLVVPEPSSLQIRVKGDPADDVVLLAFAADGMVVRERSEERVLPVIAGVTNVVVLRAKYLDSQAPVADLEVLTLGAYNDDPDKDILVRLASVTPPSGATAVLSEHINLSFRDSIEGFTRPIVRGVVDTNEDLPAVSGFPATAEINFILNTFASGTYVQVSTGLVTVQFPIVQPISFEIANSLTPGLSRSNPSQKTVVSAIQNNLTGEVVVTTLTNHGFTGGQTVRISDNSAPQANQLWTIATTPTADSFAFNAPLTVAWSGTGGSVVDTSTNAIVIAKTAPGVTHDLNPGQQFTVTGVVDSTFNGLFSVLAVVNAQEFTYQQIGFPTKDSGSGFFTKVGFVLPANAVEIGTSADITAQHFEGVFQASTLSGDIKAFAIGSSIQLQVKTNGAFGNAYTLLKSEPGVLPANQAIVLSGATFTGGVDPSPSSSAGVDLQPGDLYVVLFGELGTIELWGYDGAIFRNMTSASTATLLDYHRRNLFVNEKHLTENEKAALVGTVGTPSAINRYVTEQDTSVLTTSLAAALAGADGVPPSGTNRFLTEARIRGQRSEINVPALQDYVELPLGERWVVGFDNVGTDDTKAIQFFNVVFQSTLLSAGGPSEYAQQDFTPVTVVNVYTDALMTQILDPSQVVGADGIFPRPDAALLSLPQQLWVKLSDTPDNGTATLLYSEAVIEKDRHVQADMQMGPQRIVPAQVQDVINKASELRFNSGITLSGTSVTFPANLFKALNLQGFSLRRFVGGKPADLVASFTINLETGVGTGGIVTSYTPETFTGPTLGQWTKYVFALTPEGIVKGYHVGDLLELSSDAAYSGTLSAVSSGSSPFTDGSYVFASVGVQSDGVVGTTINDLVPSSVELYPYQEGNSRDPGSVILCGDGTSSFGHFSGTDAHIRAILWARSGDTLKLLPGTYSGNLLIQKNDITVDCSAGAQLTSPANTAITVTAKRVRILEPRFLNCNYAVDTQPGSDDFTLTRPYFGSGVVQKIKTPAFYSFSPADVNTGTDFITIAGHGYVAGASAQFTTTGTLPGGLSLLTTYYVVNPGVNSFQVSTTEGGFAADLSSIGTGTHTFGSGAIASPQLSWAKRNVGTWTITDGTSTSWAGDFNSPSALQQAHDAASTGDLIIVYPGTYSRVTWTKSGISVRGFGGGEARIDAGGGVNSCLEISGSFNQFDNLFLQNAQTGVNCITTATHNTFNPSLGFGDDVQVKFKFPATAASKHYNYSPVVCGRVNSGEAFIQANPEVTIGDGLNSWGDYVGQDAINLALSTETAGTRLRVFKGDYTPISGVFSEMIVEGAAGQQTTIRANALVDAQCIEVIGSRNTFRNLFLLADNNDNTTINLQTVGVNVTGDDNLFEALQFQLTGSNRIEPNKKYAVTSGVRNRFVPHTGAPTGYVSWTVGDGNSSFGDFNGSNGIIAAIQALPTRPRGVSGVFSVSTGSTVQFQGPNSFNIAPADVNTGTEAITKTAHGLVNNEPISFTTTGTLPAPLVSATTYYAIVSGPNDFQVALSISGPAIDLTSQGTGTHTVVSGLPLTFGVESLWRNVNINAATNAANIGSFRIIQVINPSTVLLERIDGQSFVNETSLVFDFVGGSKIWVLPGYYEPFNIPASRNDLDIEAWGSGADTLIVGDVVDSPLVTVAGSRCRVAGFRFSGGVPSVGVALAVNGVYNTFERNRFETAVRYSFGANAYGNRVYDAPEAEGRMAITVGTSPSRADFIGTTSAVLQAAITAAAADPHLGRISLGKGNWTLTTTVNVPAGLIVEGSGYNTQLIGDGSFVALTLAGGGGQTVQNIRFNNFTNSLGGVAANVFASGNWLTSAPIAGTVTGSTTDNL